MVYLLNFNITYIIILATCFDSLESSSGINFKNYCTYCFTVLGLTVFVLRQKLLLDQTVCFIFQSSNVSDSVLSGHFWVQYRNKFAGSVYSKS